MRTRQLQRHEWQRCKLRWQQRAPPPLRLTWRQRSRRPSVPRRSWLPHSSTSSRGQRPWRQRKQSLLPLQRHSRRRRSGTRRRQKQCSSCGRGSRSSSGSCARQRHGWLLLGSSSTRQLQQLTRRALRWLLQRHSCDSMRFQLELLPATLPQAAGRQQTKQWQTSQQSLLLANCRAPCMAGCTAWRGWRHSRLSRGSRRRAQR